MDALPQWVLYIIAQPKKSQQITAHSGLHQFHKFHKRPQLLQGCFLDLFSVGSVMMRQLISPTFLCRVFLALRLRTSWTGPWLLPRLSTQRRRTSWRITWWRSTSWPHATTITLSNCWTPFTLKTNFGWGRRPGAKRFSLARAASIDPKPRGRRHERGEALIHTRRHGKIITRHYDSVDLCYPTPLLSIIISADSRLKRVLLLSVDFIASAKRLGPGRWCHVTAPLWTRATSMGG